MLKRKTSSLFCTLISLLVFNSSVFAQESDSLRTINMDEVVISANKTEKPFVELTVPAKIISKKDIENSGHSRLDEIIREQVGIVTVPGFGGIEGVQLQGIDPEYTLILIDGMPLIGRVAGILDLSRISLGSVERIEIIKGASSSLYGSEALGGVINIITNKGEENEGFKSNLYYQYGSFKTQDFLTDILFNKNNITLYGNFNYYSSDGYDLIDSDDQKTVEAYNNLTLGLGFAYDMKSLGKIDLNTKIFRETRDGTIFLTSPGVNKESETHEENLYVKYTNDISKNVSLDVDLYRTTYINDEEQVSSNNIPNTNTFNQTLDRLDIRFKHSTSSGSYYTVGFGFDKETLERTNISSKPIHNSRFLYFQYDWNTSEKLNLVSGLRYDDHKQYNSQVSPKVSFKYNLSDKMYFKGSFGYGYKTPDFRQLYLNFSNSSSGYIVLGTKVIDGVVKELQDSNSLIFYNDIFNSNLTAESSNSYNLGLHYYANPSFPIELNLFRNNIFNLIETNIVGRKTNGQTIYSYSNLNKAYTQGAEIQGSYNPIKKLSIKLGYQLLYAKDIKAMDDFKSEIVYARDPVSKQSFQLSQSDYFGLYGRSRHQINLNLNYYMNQNKDNINFRINYRGKYALVDSNNNSYLDKYDKFINGHILTNLTYNKKISKKISFQVSIKNLLGYKDVENLLNNPGRSYSLKVKFNN